MKLRTALLLAALALCATPSSAQAPAEAWIGRPLADALRALQAKGLRIVFTSGIVAPDLRVDAEPRAGTPRQQLEELLAAHGLEAKDGPGGIIQVIRGKARAEKPRAQPPERPPDSNEEPAPHPQKRKPAAIISEHITVSPLPPERRDHGVPSEMSLSRERLEPFYGGFADDAVRAVQSLPRISVVDDFRSDFSIRGSPFRHVEVVVDGVATPWLEHTAYGRPASGSLSMLTSQVLDGTTLRVGAYPHRYGDRLGAELDLTVREGSRTGFTFRGAIGGTNATLIGEGPIGASQEMARGSWLVAARQSFLEWPVDRANSTRTAFGFADALGKIVYDVRPNHQLAFTMIGGVSNVDGEDTFVAGEPGAGTNRAAVTNFSWRSTLGPSFVLTQRAYIVKHQFLNQNGIGDDESHGVSDETVYRADAVRPVFGGAALIQAGAQIGRTALRQIASDTGLFPEPTPQSPVEASMWQRSVYAHVAWNATSAVRISPGLRVTSSSLFPERTITRWLLGEWLLGNRWTLSASTGISHQFPDLRLVSLQEEPRLRPERAAHLDAGIEQRIGRAARWQLTVYSRQESDILTERERNSGVVDDVVASPIDRGHVSNDLSGSSRGVEIIVDRNSSRGFSGWFSYSYGRTRYTDVENGETFWGDYDQRHSVSLFGVYRFARASASAAFHAGSNFPIPGYVTARDGGLFRVPQKNGERLPPYARLDLRADRVFHAFGRRLTVFGEVINVLDRTNLGPARGFIRPFTDEAIGFTRTLFPRRFSAGVLINF